MTIFLVSSTIYVYHNLLQRYFIFVDWQLIIKILFSLIIFYDDEVRHLRLLLFYETLYNTNKLHRCFKKSHKT